MRATWIISTSALGDAANVLDMRNLATRPASRKSFAQIISRGHTEARRAAASSPRLRVKRPFDSGRERRPAAAAAGGVRVVEGEAAPLEGRHEVDLRALQVL